MTGRKATGELLFCLSTHWSTCAASISTDSHTQARVKPCTNPIRWVAICKPRGKPCHYVHMQSTVNDDAYLLLISIPHRGWLHGLKQSPVQQSHSAGRARRRLWPGWAFCGHDNCGWVHDKAETWIMACSNFKKQHSLVFFHEEPEPTQDPVWIYIHTVLGTSLHNPNEVKSIWNWIVDFFLTHSILTSYELHFLCTQFVFVGFQIWSLRQEVELFPVI